MTAQISLALPYPPSANRYWRNVGARVLVSRQGRAYRTHVAEAVATARFRGLLAHSPMTGRLSVSMDVFPPDRRRRDLDNVRKALWDAMTDARVWLDDSQIDEDHAYRCEMVAGGAVVVTIAEIEERARQLPADKRPKRDTV